MTATANDSPTADETGQETGVTSAVQNHGSPGISRDDLFDILSNHRRRYALHSLKQRDRAVAVGDLAEEIAAWENGVSIAELTAADRKRVYTALQQFHLPKMDTTGIVEFDSTGNVALTETANALDVYLDVVTDDTISWSHYYLGLSVVSLVVTTGVWLAPFTLFPELVWAVLVASMFLLSALAHTYYNRRMRLGADGTPPEILE